MTDGNAMPLFSETDVWEDVQAVLEDAELSDVSDHARRSLRKVSQKVLEVRSNRRNGLGELSAQYFIDSALRLQKVCRVNRIEWDHVRKRHSRPALLFS